MEKVKEKFFKFQKTRELRTLAWKKKIRLNRAFALHRHIGALAGPSAEMCDPSQSLVTQRKEKKLGIRRRRGNKEK